MGIFSRLYLSILRFGFHLLYHQLAWSYDLVAAVVSAGQWRRWVLSALPRVPGPRVLELGHGPGHLQAALWEHEVWTVGLDESPQMGRLALWRGRRHEGAPRLVRGLAQQLPFPAGSFDQVAVTFPTNFLVEARTLAEVHRVLCAGGRLVVVMGAINTGSRLPERLGVFLFHSILHVSVETLPPDYAATIAATFERAGFLAVLEEIKLMGSRIFMVMADRID